MLTNYYLFFQFLTVSALCFVNCLSSGEIQEGSNNDELFKLQSGVNLNKINLKWNTEQINTGSMTLEYGQGTSKSVENWINVELSDSQKSAGMLEFTLPDVCSLYSFRLQSKKPGQDDLPITKVISMTKETRRISSVITPKLDSTEVVNDTIKLQVSWNIPELEGFSLSEATPTLMLHSLICISGEYPTPTLTSLNSANIVLDSRFVDHIRQHKTCLVILDIVDVRINKCDETIMIGSHNLEPNSVAGIPSHHHKLLTLNCQTIPDLDCPPVPDPHIPPYCNPETVKSLSIGHNKVAIAWKFPEPGNFFPVGHSVKKYIVKYGKVNGDKTKQLIYQSIEPINQLSVEPPTRHLVIKEPFNCKDGYRVQVCAVFDEETSKKSWHVLNSFTMATQRSCRKDAKTPGNLKKMLKMTFASLKLLDADIDSIIADKG